MEFLCPVFANNAPLSDRANAPKESFGSLRVLTSLPVFTFHRFSVPSAEMLQDETSYEILHYTSTSAMRHSDNVF